ncbi:MAG: alpha/beta hydrolase [Acidobacteriaceae bacterium]
MARIPETFERSASPPRHPRENMIQQTSQLNHAEVVSGRWIVKAIVLVVVCAGVALYLTVCLLFFQGQWQFTFFPPKGTTPTGASVAAKSGLSITDVRFDTTEEGVDLLDGWWIPAVRPESSIVVLFCPNGRTDLPENVAAFKAFHALGANVFAFDYQGFGRSHVGHPSQNKAYANGSAAMNYLTGMRHIPAARIAVYGARIGSAVAVHIARQSPQIAGLILADPQPSMKKEVKREQHIHVLPMWLIFRERFDIAKLLPQLKMPKLVLSTNAMREYASGAAQVYNGSPPPKQMFTIPNAPGESVYAQPPWREAVGNFLTGISKIGK